MDNNRVSLEVMQDWAKRYMNVRPRPDFEIGPVNEIYLQRWFVVPRNYENNVYLHRFVRSDDDRALHDHPWDNRSWLLDGEYLEHTQDGQSVLRKTGDVVERKAIEAHRVELISGPVISLFFTGPVIRRWGFYCPQGWRPWNEFVKVREGGNENGVGCG